jgi:hypothetical protein
MARALERCRNPWDGKCRNADIAIYISYKGEELPICSRCWRRIASMDVEW